MMHKTNSNRWMMTKGIVLPALMALAVVAFAKPKVEETPATENENTTPVVAETTTPVVAETTTLIVAETTTPTEVKPEVSLPANNDSIYDIVEVNAGFPGGEEAMYKWLAQNIKYPKECVEKGIQGRVMIQFVVNKDGSIPDIKVLKSPHSLLSEEAIRVVKAMPFWTPAKVKGKAVRSRFRLPINFKLPAKQTATEQDTQSEPDAQEVTGVPTGKTIDVIKKPTEKTISEDATKEIFDHPEENASFPGGEQAMFKWMADHLKYPKECMEKGIQGRVTVHFTIEKDGSITDVKVLRSPDDALAQEAVRMVSAMPKWKPAKQEEKAVRSNFRLPIMFRLSSAQTEQKPNN